MFDSLPVLLRTIIVGTLAYITLIILLRISGKRTLSKWNAFDFIVTVAFGSILATVLLSQDTSLVQGVVGFGLLVLLQYLISWLSIRFGAVQGWIKSQPTLLLDRGTFRYDALRQQRVTEGEVRAAVRAQGVAALEDVEAVVLETDGSFSVIKRITGSSDSALLDVEGYFRHFPRA